MTLALGPSYLDRVDAPDPKVTSPTVLSSAYKEELAKELSSTEITRQILSLRCTNASSLSTKWKVVGDIYVVGKPEQKLKHCWRSCKIAETIHEMKP